MKIWILLFLIMAAIYDYRDFKIPNKLNGAGALITLVLAGVSGMKAADMMIGVLVVLISCGLLFYIGCLGGGDVKLLMVCAISDRKSTRLNSSHPSSARMPSSA